MRIWINTRDSNGDIIAEAKDLSLIEIIPANEDKDNDLYFVMGIIEINGVEHDVNLEITKKELLVSQQD